MKRVVTTAFAASLIAFCATTLHAQDDEADTLEPAFSLSSYESFSTRDSPAFNLAFQRLTRLDFRVYRVRDPFTFFASLRDPHQIGSTERPVPEERSWIERFAAWKARQRSEVRWFFRNQVSPDYRVVRRAELDTKEIAQRVALNQTSFAQVPLLNPDQLVTSWRELLPNYRDTEYRRVPLEVKEPGVYVVEAVSGLLRAYTIVIVSDIGVVTKAAPGQVLVFAADRQSGEPRADCEVQLIANQSVMASGRTGPDGVMRQDLAETDAEDLVGIAKCGDQVSASGLGGSRLSGPSRTLLAYTYTDKPIYRPGHTAHVKSVLRWRDRDQVRAFDRPTVEFAAVDPNDKVIVRQPLKVDEFGAVHASFAIPAGAALGFYSLRMTSGDTVATAGLEVQEYRRPEFEVIVTPAARFVLQGNDVTANVQARYYFGQPVANARVRYVVNRQPYYSPHRWSDDAEEGESQFWYGGEQALEGELRLDAQGRGEIKVPAALDDDKRDYSLRIEAQVTDASSREVSGNTVIHATYAPVIVTAQVTGGYVFRPGQSVEALVRVLDFMGAPQPGATVALQLDRVTYESGRYSAPTETRIGGTQVTVGEDGRGSATLQLPNEPGSYRVRATTTASDREARDDAWMWVPGGTQITGDERYLELLTDKKTYVPGERAKLIVRGETLSSPVLITKEGQQVTWHQVLRPSGSDPIEVPIEPSDVGDFFISITFLRDGASFQAERRVGVTAQERALQIKLTAERAVAKPQDPGNFTVHITDAAGAPVRAQVSLGVIDEAVYAIRADDTPDPIRFFYRREYNRVVTDTGLSYYFVGYSGSDRLQLARRKRRPFTLADFKGDKPVQPQVRREFPDAIHWIGDLVTNAEGEAKVAIKYPDALTTWRLTARAITTDTRAGVALARTTTTKDLIVRVITPRFLTEGDQVVLPTIVHNYLADAKETSVSFAARGLQATAATPASAVSSSVASGGERRDDWRFSATTVGSAVVTATARTDADGDAVELPIPVLPYGLHREAGSSGTLHGAAEETTEVVIPSSSNPASRTVRVSLAPSLAGSLLGALDFLTSFPYGCTEQTLSSFLPNLVVTRALATLKIAPTERLTVLDRQVADGLRRLSDYQHDDGGWGWWKADRNHPFMTAYAVFGIIEARDAGYKIDQQRLENGLHSLASQYADYPRAEPDLKAYMAYVLLRGSADAASIIYQQREQRPERGDRERGASRSRGERSEHKHSDALNDLWIARDRMSSYGRALLLLALDHAKDTRGNELASALVAEAQTKGDVSWWKSDRDPLLFDFVDTSVEATATAVRALAQRDPRNPLLDRAIRSLMQNRSGGYWSTTKQTAMALYGLVEVLHARNETPQPYTVDVYVNGTLAGTHAFTAASITDPDPAIISAIAREGQNTVRIVKRGGAALYWSAAAVYHDTQAAEARSGSRQLAITRRYALLTPVKQRDGNIAYREEPFSGQMRPGDVLTVRITVAGSSDWRYLVIEDPLPAGVEAIQETTSYPLERASERRWWWGSQVEYRDNRTVFFQESFDEGRYEYLYFVKAISSGEFRAIPAQIQPMYVPGVAASSEPQTVIVALPGAGSR